MDQQWSIEPPLESESHIQWTKTIQHYQQTYKSSTGPSSLNWSWWFPLTQSGSVKAFIVGIRLVLGQILLVRFWGWGRWGWTWARALLPVFPRRKNDKCKIFHAQLFTMQDAWLKILISRWFEMIDSGPKLHILWSVMICGELFQRSIFTRVWGLFHISSPIQIMISFMGGIFFAALNIQTEIHWVTLLFFPSVLSKAKQKKTWWTDFGLAWRCYQSTLSQAGLLTKQ